MRSYCGPVAYPPGIPAYSARQGDIVQPRAVPDLALGAVSDQAAAGPAVSKRSAGQARGCGCRRTSRRLKKFSCQRNPGSLPM